MLGVSAPHAIHVHAKSREFNAQGEETQIDYRMCLEALKTAGYAGAISIEYEGDGDPAIGIKRTRELIEKYAVKNTLHVHRDVRFSLVLHGERDPLLI